MLDFTLLLFFYNGALHAPQCHTFLVSQFQTPRSQLRNVSQTTSSPQDARLHLAHDHTLEPSHVTFLGGNFEISIDDGHGEENTSATA